MFSDKSTFRLIRGVPKVVHCTSTTSWFDPKFTVKTVKHSASVMVWSTFSGNIGHAGLYFLPKNVTIKGSNYIHILKVICLHSGGVINVTISCMMGPQQINQNLSQNF